jgi:hypothetical protein
MAELRLFKKLKPAALYASPLFDAHVLGLVGAHVGRTTPAKRDGNRTANRLLARIAAPGAPDGPFDPREFGDALRQVDHKWAPGIHRLVAAAAATLRLTWPNELQAPLLKFLRKTSRAVGRYESTLKALKTRLAGVRLRRGEWPECVLCVLDYPYYKDEEEVNQEELTRRLKRARADAELLYAAVEDV